MLWKKVKDRLNTAFHLRNRNSYLYVLLGNLKKVQEQQIDMPFVIQSAQKYYCLVKIGGLYATVAYRDMPWQYNSLQHWQAISSHLSGIKLYGKVSHISDDIRPFRIMVSAQEHIFKKKELTVFEKYQAVVLQKMKYGLLVEAGYHFKWKYGCIVGMIHKSAFSDIEEYEQAHEGKIISTYFHGHDALGRITFGGFELQREWLTGELDELVGTRQKITVKIDSSGRRTLLVQNKYKAVLTVYKSFYPKKYIQPIRKFRAHLKEGDAFEAQIHSISKRKHFVLKLVLKSLEENR